MDTNNMGPGSSAINLTSIVVKSEFQPRVKLDLEVVQDYVERLKDGDTFPPVIVYKVSENNYILASGFHRFEAHKIIQSKQINAVIREYSSDLEVLKEAIESNVRHGARLKNEDKRRSVTLVLKNSEGKNLADNYVAKICGVSNHLVKDIREELFSTSEKSDTVQTYKDGKAIQINTENIGCKSKNIITPEYLSKKLDSKTIDLVGALTNFRVSHDLENVKIPDVYITAISDFISWYLAKKGA